MALTDILFDSGDIPFWTVEIPVLNGAGSWTDALGDPQNFLFMYIPSTGGFSVFSIAF